LLNGVHPHEGELAQHRGYPAAMARLIEELGRLPGVGPRTSERLATHLLLAPREEALALAEAIREVKSRLRRCSVCCNFAEGDPCAICADDERDPRRICVVEEPRDVAALEDAGVHRGRYHVLGGRLAPLEGRTESALTLRRLSDRVGELLASSLEPVEIILATNPNLEGEGTALGVADVLRRLPGAERLECSRIATGMPTGSAIEYVHREVLVDAFSGRRVFAPPAARSDEPTSSTDGSHAAEVAERP
jgi:recombination protein RecR